MILELGIGIWESSPETKRSPRSSYFKILKSEIVNQSDRVSAFAHSRGLSYIGDTSPTHPTGMAASAAIRQATAIPFHCLLIKLGDSLRKLFHRGLP
jgi:hypothetical protein